MENSLNVDRLLAALSDILSERTGAAVTIMKGEYKNDICCNETPCKMALSEILVG